MQMSRTIEFLYTIMSSALIAAGIQFKNKTDLIVGLVLLAAVIAQKVEWRNK